MTVNNVETVLVIMLAIGFATLLVLSIILVSLMIAVMRNVKRVSQRAEEFTANASELASMVSQKVAPFALSAAVAAIARKFKQKR